MNDRYTKAVLTVIAAALVWIAVHLSTAPVSAANPITLKQIRSATAAHKDDLVVVPVYVLQ